MKKDKTSDEGVSVLPPAPPLNPYSLLLKQVKALLALEVQLHPDHKAKSSWQVMHAFCGVDVLIGKGGHNTCFWTFGHSTGGQRKLGYPHEIITILQRMSKQSHYLYEITEGGKTRTAFTIRKVLKREPKDAKAKIVGIIDGSASVVYVARPNATGKISWLKRT